MTRVLRSGVALSLAVSLGAASACGVDPSPDGEEQSVQRRFDGEELIDGLVFGVGPVADVVPEATQFDFDGLSEEGRRDLEQRLQQAEMSPEDLEDLRGLLERSEAFQEIRAEILDRVRSDDPTFLPRFADAIQSGDHFLIAAALDEAADKVGAAATGAAEARPNDLTAATDPQGWVIGPVFALVAVFVSAGGAIYTFAVVAETAFWGGGQGGDTALTREKTVQLIAERLPAA